jgi:lipoate-protein ligase B
MLCVYYWDKPIGYTEAYNIQRVFWNQNLATESPDTLLLLQHSPTFTIGRSGKLENLLLSSDELAKIGAQFFFTDRGGDITYHGPGQLVAYPIIDLRRRGKDVHGYVRDLEEVIIRTLADFSIEAYRDEKNVGVWVDNEKIAAIGVRISKWVTMHGLALNIDPSLDYFSCINPCGIVEKRVTSMVKVLSRNVSVEEVAGSLTDNFCRVFTTHIERVVNGTQGCGL